MSGRVEIVEVGPRDGLQAERRIVPTAEKVGLVDALSGCGFARVEVTSFVSAAWVPQLADGAAVMGAIRRRPGVRYAALVPNARGYAAARAAGVDEVAIFASVSDGFSRANLNAPVADVMDRLQPVASRAAADGVPVRGYLSCVVECPFDGAVAPEAVARLAERFVAMGCHEVSLGDTIGRATPEGVDAMLAAVCGAVAPDRLAGHFHDTAGGALANVDVALDHGLRVFDAAVGGLGGCPYAPGAAGNVATEAVLAHLRDAGFETGLDADAVAACAAMARRMRGNG
ncbi:hydroxymethylglutaryl-CoA lyase [Jannaschia sp. LMIT008]|uniref:hydroxymethylglutaryl-CoA lyase n=1 Tax=Jannaschia maritima TaxID=3032585 RepID=UPI0028114E6A|nr:hydroxymethylglutaryl-CoA lyase [Jannaschia sp. LMIT008]